MVGSVIAMQVRLPSDMRFMQSSRSAASRALVKIR